MCGGKKIKNIRSACVSAFWSFRYFVFLSFHNGLLLIFCLSFLFLTLGGNEWIYAVSNSNCSTLLLLTYSTVYESVESRINLLLNVYSRIILPDIYAIQRYLLTKHSTGYSKNTKTWYCNSIIIRKLSGNPMTAQYHPSARESCTTASDKEYCTLNQWLLPSRFKTECYPNKKTYSWRIWGSFQKKLFVTYRYQKGQ